MKSNRFVVLDLGASHVAAAEFALAGPHKLVLRKFAQQSHSADSALDADWMDRTAQALKAVAAASRTGGAARIAIPGYLTLIKSTKAHSVAPARRGKVIDFEAAQAIPFPLQDVVWEHEVLADDGCMMELRFAAARREAVERICLAAKSAGYRVTAVQTPAAVLGWALPWIYPGATAPVLMADIGARTTTLAVIGPGGSQIRILQMGGNMITAGIAADFQLDFAQAELLKLQALPVERLEAGTKRPAVQRAMEKFTAQLQIEIARSVANHLRQAGAPPVALYLTGGGSLVTGLGEALAEKFHLQVQHYDPWRKVEISPAACAAGAAACTHRLAPLVGLARSALADQGGATGLLPPDLRKAQALRRRQPYGLGLAALLVWALLPPIRYYRRLAHTLGAQTSAITHQVQPLQATAARNARHLAEIRATRDRAAVVRRLVDDKSTWAGFMADLQQRLDEIEDAWLDELTLAPARADAPEWRLTLSGRLLDAGNPGSKASPESRERAKRLLGRLAGSPYATAITNEQFDNSQPGVLRFNFTLVVNPGHPL